MDNRRSGMRWAVVVVLVVVAMLVGAVGGGLTGAAAGYYVAAQHIATTASDQTATSTGEAMSLPVVNAEKADTASITELTVQSSSAVIDAVRDVEPAVVTVVNTLATSNNNLYFYGQQLPNSEAPKASGSGVIIDKQGYIVTNNHVVEDTQGLEVILADGTSAPAELIGTDVFADLAVIKVDIPVPAVAELGDSSALQPGETVIAIGSALGDFKNTVTAGVVSALDRQIDTGQGYSMEGMIQTDAAINSGNSGGPLINLAGQVVGINTMVIRGSSSGYSASAEGLGFSVPSNAVKEVSQQLIETGYVSRPYMGISYQSVTPQLAGAYDLPAQYGAYLQEVAPGLAADEAGLQQGDIIVALDGDEITEDQTFVNLLLRHHPGETLELKVIRDGNEMTVPITLGERPQS